MRNILLSFGALALALVSVVICFQNGGKDMGTAEWISILIAVIGVIGVLATTLFQLKRDGKTIDKIDNRTEDISKATFTVNNISTSVDKANEMLNSITPEIKTISHTTNKIDFIASEIEYQKRLNEKVSTDISNKDVIVETIKKLYEENARLNKSLQMEKANNLILSQKLKQYEAEHNSSYD